MNKTWATALSVLMGVALLGSGCCGTSSPSVPTNTPVAVPAAAKTSASPVAAAETSMEPARPLITPDTEETMTVTIYFSQEGQEDCTTVVPLERRAPASADIARATLDRLFAGPTVNERTEGFSSWFSAETASILLSLRIDGSRAYVNLKDIRPIIPGANSSCGSQMFFAQIETTLKNIVPVDKMFYAIEGDPVAFYEWIQIGCDPVFNNCDPAPFATP